MSEKPLCSLRKESQGLRSPRLNIIEDSVPSMLFVAKKSCFWSNF